MIPTAPTTQADDRQAGEPAPPRHLLRTIRRLNALYDELNQIVEAARAGESSAPR